MTGFNGTELHGLFPARRVLGGFAGRRTSCADRRWDVMTAQLRGPSGKAAAPARRTSPQWRGWVAWR